MMLMFDIRFKYPEREVTRALADDIERLLADPKVIDDMRKSIYMILARRSLNPFIHRMSVEVIGASQTN